MKMLKPSEVAEQLNVSVNTLQRWDRDGILSAYRTPTNRRYYTQEQINDYLNNDEGELIMDKAFYQDLIDQIGYLQVGEEIKLIKSDETNWGITCIEILDCKIIIIGCYAFPQSFKVFSFEKKDENKISIESLSEYLEGYLDSYDDKWIILEEDKISFEATCIKLEVNEEDSQLKCWCCNKSLFNIIEESDSVESIEACFQDINTKEFVCAKCAETEYEEFGQINDRILKIEKGIYDIDTK